MPDQKSFDSTWSHPALDPQNKLVSKILQHPASVPEIRTSRHDLSYTRPTLRLRKPKNEPFHETTEYRRFKEFSQACKEDGYIGVCLGRSGVGKSIAARRYSQWRYFHHLSNSHFERVSLEQAGLITACDTVFYTPPVSVSASALKRQVLWLVDAFELAVLKLSRAAGIEHPAGDEPQVKLIIIDECNRLKIPAMEQVRDLYDQLGIPVVLIGLPGFEKYVGRFPQLSSRIGFYHEFQPLAADELMEILETELLNEFEFGFTNQVFDSRESMSSLVRVTGGNLRTLSRLCLQMKRVMTVNNLELINEEVIQTARRAIVATIR